MKTQDTPTVACHGCGTEMAPLAVKRIDVKVAGQWTQQPMCRTCASNHAAKQAFGGAYLAISDRPNRAARRHPQVAPVVKPERKRRPTRGERRQVKKDAAVKAGKERAA